MRKTRFAALSASVLLFASPLAQAYLPGSVSGPFYNPEQSGHGINVSIVDDQRAIVTWHTFTTEGTPLTLYAEGQIDGRRIVAQAYAPEGMRFGEFNPDDIQVPHWGSLEVAFDDCNHATLSWNADDPTYADGTMPVQRLVQPIGVDCTLPVANDIPPGRYLNTSDQGRYFEALVDEDGVLWAVTNSAFGSSLAIVATPSDAIKRVITDPNTGITEITELGFATHNAWMPLPSDPFVKDVGDSYSKLGVDWHKNPDGQYTLTLPDVAELTATTDESDEVVKPLLPSDLPGSYEFTRWDGMILTAPSPIEIAADGSVCVTYYFTLYVIPAPCDLTGTIKIANSELGTFEFRLISPYNPTKPAYFGRGWLRDDSDHRHLVMIGHPDGHKGFGLVATKQP